MLSILNTDLKLSIYYFIIVPFAILNHRNFVDKKKERERNVKPQCCKNLTIFNFDQ